MQTATLVKKPGVTFSPYSLDMLSAVVMMRAVKLKEHKVA